MVILEGVLVSVFVFAIAYGVIGLTAYLVFSFVVVDVVSPSTVTEGVLSLALVLILLMVPLGMYGFLSSRPSISGTLDA